MKDTSNHDTLGQQFGTTDGTHGWLGQELEVKSDPMMDAGTGENILMRVFNFGANPENLKRDKPSKQQIFDSHAKQLMTMLWSDGLEPVQSMNPLIQVSKKKEKYRIILWCKARGGVTWNQAPRKLQELTKPS